MPVHRDLRRARGLQHLLAEAQAGVDALELVRLQVDVEPLAARRRRERRRSCCRRSTSREQADPVAEASHRVDEARPPERAVLVAERRRERDRILDRGGLDHEAAVLVVLELHAVRRDRVDHVRVLRLVEESVHQADRVDAEMPPDGPVREAGAEQELRRVERARGDDDGAGAHGVARSRLVDVLDPGRLGALHDHALDLGVRPQLEDAPRERVGDVGVHRRLAGVRGAALDARAAARAVGVRVRVDRLELGAERPEALVHRVDALLPVGALSHPEDAARRGRSTGRGRRPRRARSGRSSAPSRHATSRRPARARAVRPSC